jgi:uncharacterized damage-inducible protein DinB
LKQDSLDLAPVGGPAFEQFLGASRAQVLERFDQTVAAARAAIAEAGDQEYMKPWSLLRSGQTLMTMPKIAVVRSFVMNHIIHHRGQLGVSAAEQRAGAVDLRALADEGSSRTGASPVGITVVSIQA